jgi:squalene cyclase
MLRSTLPLAALLLVLAPRASAQEPGGGKRDAVERAVDRALSFLKSVQESDGAWRENHGKNPAVTALAVMAFLSAGHVPGEGPYADTVERGIRWVLSQQKPNGLLATVGGHEMYHHGICTLMLSEVVGMTQGKLAREVKAKLEKAVKVVLRAQRPATAGLAAGGWRYRTVGNDADMSVTGWQLLALRAAKNVGCDVPAQRIDMAVEYIKRSQDPRTGGFGYTPRSGYTIPCTGTGILGLEICGRKGKDPSPEAKRAGSFLINHAPTWGSGHFFYAVYYCSQATFQLGGSIWGSYRDRLHKSLLPHQQHNGAWLGGDGYGPSYATSMSVLALTVEYRFLPIYQRGEEPTAPRK